MAKQGYYQNKIPDPHASLGDAREYVCGRIDRNIFNYFFKHVLPGDRGPRQAIIATLFQRFYEACLTEGIAPGWNPDESNERRVNEILQRLNFNPPTTPVQRPAVTRKQKPE